jgi:hypothetical protein
MKKKVIAITSVILIVVLAVAGTALAGNGSGEAGSGGRRFASQLGEYETTEEFHQAMVDQKIAIVNEKLANDEVTQEDADAIIAHLTACDGTCEFDGGNPARPEDGWKIFGNGSGLGESRGNKGGLRDGSGECTGEGLQPGNGTGNGYRGGRSK